MGRDLTLKWVGSCLLVATLALVMFPTIVAAAPPAQDDRKTQADALIDEGITFFYQDDYQGALNKFADSLKLCA